MKIFTLFNSKKIRTAAAGSLGIKFLSALFAFLNSVLLARILGVEQFGIYILAFSTSLLLSIPVSMGLPTLLTRYISKYDVGQQYSAIKGLLIRSNQTVIAATLIIFIGALLSYLFWWSTMDTMLVDTLWLSFLLLPLLALGSLRAAALRGLRYIILGQLPDTLLRNFLLCLGIVFFWIFGVVLSPLTAMAIHVGAAAIAYGVGYLFLRKKLLLKLKTITPEFNTKEWMREAFPFTINSGVQVLKSRLLTFILAIFGSLEAVALFDVALRGAALVSYTLDALNTAIAPYISKAHESNNRTQLQRIVKKTSKLIFLCAIPVVIIFIVGGRPLLNLLFGNAYAASYMSLVILCFGQLANAATGSVGLVLNMTGHQLYHTKVNFYVTLVCLLVSIPLILFFDVEGAAISFSLILIIQNLILVQYSNRTLKINTTVFSSWF